MDRYRNRKIDSYPGRNLSGILASPTTDNHKDLADSEIFYTWFWQLHRFSLYAHTNWWLYDTLQTGNKHAIKRQN